MSNHDFGHLKNKKTTKSLHMSLDPIKSKLYTYMADIMRTDHKQNPIWQIINRIQSRGSDGIGKNVIKGRLISDH